MLCPTSSASPRRAGARPLLLAGLSFVLFTFAWEAVPGPGCHSWLSAPPSHFSTSCQASTPSQAGLLCGDGFKVTPWKGAFAMQPKFMLILQCNHIIKGRQERLVTWQLLPKDNKIRTKEGTWEAHSCPQWWWGQARSRRLWSPVSLCKRVIKLAHVSTGNR